jgi:TRAP transporter 4TM/12TM fusion protein
VAGVTAPAEPDDARAAPEPSGEGEAPGRALAGRTRLLASALAAGLSLYAVWWVVAIIPAHVYRPSFLLVALVLVFLLHPARRGARGASRASAWDWLLVALTVAALGWPLLDRADFPYRAATPTPLDLAMGAAAILLVLEGARRTTGWVLPATAAGFILYAYIGPLLDLVGLGAIAHRGYYIDRLVGMLYMTLDGIFGVPLDVAATYIILFTLFGAVLDATGAARFFIDWAMALAGRSGSAAAAGRAVTLAGFLLGTVSGSGVATTATLGTVAWPLLRRAGYGRETGGAILAASGIGALLSPPTLGIPYLRVLSMAVVPTALYYLSAALMVEGDARRLRAAPVGASRQPAGALLRRGWHHFLPLAVIVALMALGMTAFRAVLLAAALAVALSWVRGAAPLGPRRLTIALAAGGRGALGIIATTAVAGIVVGVVTLTGLGLEVAGLIVALAGGGVLPTVLLSALAVWLLGLAVPVTASYILAAVTVAPALVQVGIPDVAAHMFIFYYAVLSEVSPPTALAPFAAAAVTGGNPVRTMLVTWKYTLPAFLVPFAFTLEREGMGLLLQAPPLDVARASLTAALGVAAGAVAFGGRLAREASRAERIGAGLGGALLFLGGGLADVAGLAACLAVAGVHLARARRLTTRGPAPPPPPPPGATPSPPG